MGYNPTATGTSFQGSSRSVSTNFVNATGGSLPKGSVVSTNVNGQIVLIDITNQDSVSRFMGITSIDLPAAATGGVVAIGRVEKVTTSFAIGDALYVNTDGTLINVKPDYGVGNFAEGYFVIFIGVVIKNEFDASLKDFQVNPSVIGQL